MIIEALIEQSIIDALQSELGDDVQLVGSRLQTKVEDADKKTIVAVASAFRNHDAFSLSLINVPVAISVATRVEGDAQSQEHNATVEKIVDLLVGWHKDGEAMEEALSNEKFLAGELRMDGGTTQTFDRERMIWTDAININIRGAEKFPAPTVVTYLDGAKLKMDIQGEMTYQWASELTKSNVKSVDVGEKVTRIGDGAFAGFNNIVGVVVPQYVESIAQYAFNYSSVSSLTMNGRTKDEVRGMEYYSWGLADGCAIHCSDGDIVVGNDTTVKFNDNTVAYVEVDTALRYGWDQGLDSANIKEIVVGNSVQSIGGGAFDNLNSLVKITIPLSVVSIDQYTLYNQNIQLVVMKNRTTQQVRAMRYYPWQYHTGGIIRCTDGDITI